MVEKYKVFKVYRKSGEKIVLQRDLTKKQAIKIVNAFPDSEKTMVCFAKQ